MQNPGAAGITRASADYAELLAKAVGETPAAFFANLHRLFQQPCNAPLMRINVARSVDDESPRTYYPDGDESAAFSVDPSLVARAIDAAHPLARW